MEDLPSVVVPRLGFYTVIHPLSSLLIQANELHAACRLMAGVDVSITSGLPFLMITFSPPTILLANVVLSAILKKKAEYFATSCFLSLQVIQEELC